MYPGCEICQEIQWLMSGGESVERIATRLGRTVGTIKRHRYWYTPHTDRIGREPQEFCQRGHRMADTGAPAPWQRGRRCMECKRFRESKAWIRKDQTVAPEYAELYQRVGGNIRRLREKRKWTQEALAEAVGMPRLSLLHAEDGTRYLRLHEFLALAKAFNIKARDLL